MSSKKKSKPQTSVHDLKTYDLFQLTPFLSVGEPYIANKDSVLKDGRSKGRQLQTTPQKSGILNESTFGPFLSLATTEPYQPYKDFKRSEGTGKQINQKPFIPSSPTKKLTGPGDTHGCFNTLEYMSNGGIEEELNSTRARTAGHTSRASTSHSRARSASGSPTKGGSYTTRGRLGSATSSADEEFLQPPFRPSSPNKKGIYGTFSPFPEYIGAGGYDTSLVKSRDKKIKVPFRSMSPPLRGWDMSVYQPTTSPKPSKTKSKNRGPTLVQPPFRPSSPNKKGLYGTFSPYPEYIAGADLQPEKRPKSSTGERTKVFVPTGAFSTNTPQPSILAMAARSQP